MHLAKIYSPNPLSTDFQRGQLFNLYTIQKFKLNQFGKVFPLQNYCIPKYNHTNTIIQVQIQKYNSKLQKLKLNQFGKVFPFQNSRIPKETCRQWTENFFFTRFVFHHIISLATIKGWWIRIKVHHYCNDETIELQPMIPQSNNDKHF